MARIETQSAPLRIRQQRPCPVDFDETFVRIGRQACEEHYRVRRTTVDRWLVDRGKARLVTARAEHVRPSDWRPNVRQKFLDALASGATVKAAAESAGATVQIIRQWRRVDPAFAAAWAKALDSSRKLTRTDIARILAQVVPVEDRVSFTLARHAAQFLRVRRNGGFIVSPTPGGDWWVGSRRRTAAELVALAESRGFDRDGE